MIKTITLTSFRRHEALSVNLTEGLQTFRGVNEAGKTTILEGAAYALFGSKALRDPLADVVTWGHKESELTVTVHLEMNGKDYYFTRSKGGAEVLLSDGSVFVTGQTEVSNFAAGLLGADVNVAHHLMLSSQGGMRGILEQGPKATSNLIETLSDLDLIDRIIDAATEKLQTGSTVVLEDRLKTAELALTNTVAPVAPVAPDLDAMRTALTKAQDDLTSAVTARTVAQAAFTAEQTKRDQRDRLEKDKNLILAQAEETAISLAEAKAQAEVVVPALEGYRSALADAEDWEAKAKAWRVYQSLVLGNTVLPSASFSAMNQRLRKELDELKDSITTHKTAIKVLEPQLSTNHLCPACGQDTAHLEHVKEKQERVVQGLAYAKEELAKAEAKLPEAMADVAELDQILAHEASNTKKSAPVLKYFTVDPSTMPTTYTWNGEPFDDSEGPDADYYRRELAKVEAAHLAKTQAQAKVEALCEVIAKGEKRCKEIEAFIFELSLVSDEAFLALSSSYNDAASVVTIAEGLVAMAKINLDEAEHQYNEAKKAYDTAVSHIDSLNKTVATLVGDIATVQFNNQLIKKVRAARPIIANKLWNMVLSTVSTLFTQMRGETSIVTKVGDKFLINGKSSSVSGSTLDILGLAIRCALIKTFVPNCPFLILDEPSAACDAERSAALIGFVAAAGFKQVILVTHEDVSEALSSNLIQI